MPLAPDPDPSRDWTIVATLTDPVEAEMLEDVLRQAGIAVSMPGLQHRAMLGVLGGYVSIPVHVPVHESSRALELLEAFRATPQESAGASDEAAPQIPPPRSPKAAAGVGMLGVAVLASVGAGHLYVRQYLAAAALFVLGWISAISLLNGSDAWPTIPLLVLIDMIGAASAAGRQTRGELVRTNRHGLAVIVLAITAFALSPMVARFLSYHFEAPPPGDQHDRSLEWDGRTR